MLIVITHPEIASGEACAIEALIEAGATYVHIRKPEATEEQVSCLVESISPACYSALSMHYHHQLAKLFSLGGMHQSKGFVLPDSVEFRYSGGCHSIEELNADWEGFNYLFLSPIFDSISKSGYLSGFDAMDISTLMESRAKSAPKLIALGGVSYNNVDLAYSMGFDGVALLGGVWDICEGKVNHANTVKRFKQIKLQWESRCL